MTRISPTAVLLTVVTALFWLAYPGGAEAGGLENGPVLIVGQKFLWIAIILLAAKLSNLVGHFGQPPVLGELAIGIVMGNLALAGWHFFEPIRQDFIIRFLAELGVVVLLFQVGLESDVRRMMQVGPRALLVALVGVVVPFFLGTALVGPLILPGRPFITYLFLGAILTATSVGITVRVFQDLGRLKTPEAQIILGAAVIDDVLGLAILAVVKAVAETGDVQLGGLAWITFKAILFLGAAIYLGQALARGLGELLSRINPGIGMKFILAICFGLVFAAFAESIGLAPIVGAFAAGLVLEPVHFKHFDDPDVVKDIEYSIRDAGPEVRQAVSDVLCALSRSHVEELIQPLSYFLVPLFFVLTGMQVRLEVLLNLPILVTALAITLAAFAGKIVSGLVAGKVDRAVVGWGMVPRGEVGLIFAATGRAIGAVPDDIFSMVVIVIVLTTLLPPPVLNTLVKRRRAAQASVRPAAMHPEN